MVIQKQVVQQYCKDQSDDNMTDSKSFKFKSRFLSNTGNTGGCEFLIYFWRTHENAANQL